MYQHRRRRFLRLVRVWQRPCSYSVVSSKDIAASGRFFSHLRLVQCSHLLSFARSCGFRYVVAERTSDVHLGLTNERHQPNLQKNGVNRGFTQTRRPDVSLKGRFTRVYAVRPIPSNNRIRPKSHLLQPIDCLSPCSSVSISACQAGKTMYGPHTRHTDSESNS